MNAQGKAERKIVERCKNGDIRAFERVFELYGRKLFGLCLRMSGSRADAEDLMQDVFVILLTKIKAFREEAKFSTWLYRVAVNTCISHLRRRKHSMVPLDEEPEIAGAMSVKPSPMQQRAELKRAITGLPAGYRAAVILHDLQGFNHREIAKIMGISEGASKSQLFKARRKLRNLLTFPRAQEAY